jgi:hypothetical protein
MKAREIEPEPVEPTIALEMTKAEAQALYRVTTWNVTVPDALKKDEWFGQRKLSVTVLLSRIREALFDAGIRA